MTLILVSNFGCTNNNQAHILVFVLRYSYASGCVQNSNLTKEECYKRALDYEKRISSNSN